MHIIPEHFIYRHIHNLLLVNSYLKKSCFYYFIISLSTISYSQNVGIGASIPLMKLHVTHSDSALLLIENTQLLDVGINNALYFKIGNGNFPYTGAIKTIGDSPSLARIGLFTFAAASPNGLRERLSITDSGNVGIGTIVPANKFSVLGNVDISGRLGIGTVTPDPSAKMEISSGNGGFLPPRMDSNARDNINNPAAGLVLWCTDCGSSGELQVYDGAEWLSLGVNIIPQPPSVATASISNITGTSALSGGNVAVEGSSPVTARGVCWSTTPSPTVASNLTNDGNGLGSFVSNITGLQEATIYFVRAYAISNAGVSYGDEFQFQTAVIGQSFGGGIIAYIYKPGDPGYIEGEVHGIIAAPFDQSTGAEWGCEGTAISGADGTALGTGVSNTTDIYFCTTPGIAARICGDLILNSKNDWVLPSIDELNKLYLNKSTIGGFSNLIYWSSSETNPPFDLVKARYIQFSTGVQNIGDKGFNARVRAIRYF